tara:strand:- start:3807 stop:4370 length:564 start_codon:yes stop_codon:yes gene_type:complete
MNMINNTKKYPLYKDIKTIVFDFDGIFTDNKVYLNENGEESIRFDKSDSLGFDLLRKFKELKKWDVKILVLTKEKNKVVLQRCKKLKLTCFLGVDDKKKFILDNFSSDLDSKKKVVKNLIYLGNDLNDLKSIEIANYSFAPIDAHKIVKRFSTYVLPFKGGKGFIRSFIETIINLDKLKKEELFKII